MTSRAINRRQALAFLGAGAGAAVLGACGAGSSSGSSGAASSTTSTTSGPSTTASSAAGATIDAGRFAGAASCTATVEQTEGPYHIDVDKIRADIREDREGVPLRVAARVVDVDGCTPVRDAVFEIWHCDAGGDYSGFGEAPAASRFLRGGQVTNADGIAVITTIYPGHYQGRCVHIHAKVALTNDELLTTQLYFDDAVSDRVFASAPYEGGRRTMNAADGIYDASTTLTLEEDGDGYLGLITIGVRA
jgi:protocatechuate 3,4-dioxygenase beta subunit